MAAVCDVDRRVAWGAAAEDGCTAYVDVEGPIDVESLGWVHVATPVQTRVDVAL